MAEQTQKSRRKRLVYVYTTPVMPWFFQRGQNEYLRDCGYELHLVSSPNSFMDRVCARDKMIAHPLEIPRPPSPWKDLKALLGLIKLFRELKPDIVHAGAPKSALLGMMAAAYCRVPARFFACHGTITGRRSGLPKQFYRMIEGFTASLAHQAWCVSPSLLSFMRSEGIIRANKGILMGSGSANGFREEWLSDPAAPFPEVLSQLEEEKSSKKMLVIGFMGRLCRQKGIETMAVAWPELKKRYPEARLLLAGPWEENDQISPQIRKSLENDPGVILPGPVEQGAIGRCYRLMDVLLMPAIATEGFGNVVLEAVLFGVPTVTTKCIGCVDAVMDGVTGSIIPPGDAAALTRAVIAYLDNPDLAKVHGLAALERVRRDFRPELIWEGLRREYDSLLGDTAVVGHYNGDK